MRQFLPWQSAKVINPTPCYVEWSGDDVDDNDYGGDSRNDVGQG